MRTHDSHHRACGCSCYTKPTFGGRSPFHAGTTARGRGGLLPRGGLGAGKHHALNLLRAHPPDQLVILIFILVVIVFIVLVVQVLPYGNPPLAAVPLLSLRAPSSSPAAAS